MVRNYWQFTMRQAAWAAGEAITHPFTKRPHFAGGTYGGAFYGMDVAHHWPLRPPLRNPARARLVRLRQPDRLEADEASRIP